MTRLPAVRPRECIAALKKAGFKIERYKGGHCVMYKDSPPITIVVPLHRNLPKGTLRAILRQADISIQDFIKYLS